MRYLLIVAMVVSLWPAGAIAAIAINGSSHQTESKSEPSASAVEFEENQAVASEAVEEAEESAEREREEREAATRSHKTRAQKEEATKKAEALVHRFKEEEVEEQAERKLRPILESSHSLNDEFVKVEFTEGVPESSYKERAENLEAEIGGWLGMYGSKVDHKVRAVGESIEDQAQALTLLAAYPDEEALDAYNETVTEFNHAVKRLTGK